MAPGLLQHHSCGSAKDERQKLPKSLKKIGFLYNPSDPMKSSVTIVSGLFAVVTFVSVTLVCVPEVAAALRPYNYMGRITRVDAASSVIEIETDVEWQNGEWNPYNYILEGKAPRDALNELEVDDYVEAASLGQPGEIWVAIGKVKFYSSGTEKFVIAMYGDPAFLISTILGEYNIEYNNTPDCSTCAGNTNCKAVNTTVTITDENGRQVDTIQLLPGQSHAYESQTHFFKDWGYSIEITFHSGEVSAYPECTDQPVPGPQSVSDLTIHIYEFSVDYCLGSFLICVFLFSAILVTMKKGHPLQK